MARAINIFEKRDVRDYNSHTVLNALRSNCVRAVELDDKQQTKKKGTYLLAMKGVADAIYSELGIKAAKADKAVEVEAVVIEDSEAYKKLEGLLTATQERSVEQESELEELDKEIETMAAKIKDLEAKHKATAKKPTAKKATKKGAK